MAVPSRNIHFYGSIFRQSDTVSLRDLPVGEKLLLALFVLSIPVGALAAVGAMLLHPNQPLLFVSFILYTLAVSFMLAGIEGCLHFRGRGTVAVRISQLFFFLGFLLLIGPACVGRLFLTLDRSAAIGVLILLFTALWLVGGIALWVAGARALRRNPKKYSVEVKATCVSIETVRAIVNADASFAGLVTTADVSRPVWHYHFEGQEYYVAPQYYSGSLRIDPGTEKVLYLNPDHPEKFFAGDARMGKMLIALGVSFLLVALFCLVILVVMRTLLPAGSIQWSTSF